jgi:hypothetical protein
MVEGVLGNLMPPHDNETILLLPFCRPFSILQRCQTVAAE